MREALRYSFVHLERGEHWRTGDVEMWVSTTKGWWIFRILAWHQCHEEQDAWLSRDLFSKPRDLRPQPYWRCAKKCWRPRSLTGGSLGMESFQSPKLGFHLNVLHLIPLGMMIFMSHQGVLQPPIRHFIAGESQKLVTIPHRSFRDPFAT